MKNILILPILFLITACQTTPQIITKTQYRVIDVPRALADCPQLKDFPNPSTLKDKQVAKLLVQLVANNKKCKASVDAIFSYLDEAKKIIEKE